MRVITLALACAFLVGACGGAAVAPSPSPSPTAKPTIVAKTADSAFGKILVDKEGKTLYIWFKDTDENRQCYDACATAWQGRARTASSMRLKTCRRSRTSCATQRRVRPTGREATASRASGWSSATPKTLLHA